MFVLHLLRDLVKKFGGVANYLLKSICRSKGKIVHFVSDNTVSPSIKDAERDSRSSEFRDASFSITGSLQNRPTN